MREFIRDLMQKEGLNEEISSKILKILQTHENGGNIPEYLGQVYEEIMQKIDIKKWGQVYTPQTIIDLILQLTLKKKGKNLTICDPSCGSGYFLISAYRFLRNSIGKAKTIKENVLPQIYGIEIR